MKSWPTLLLLCMSLALAHPARAVEPIQQIVTGEGPPGAELVVASPPAKALRRTVATLEHPPLTRALYAIRGQVRCRGVAGQGYLEMWSFFPDGGRYFSRTLAGAGPMRWLAGDQSWRPFVLPFQNKSDGPAPARLVVNVVLPGGGEVGLRSLELAQYAPGEDPLVLASGAWLSDQQAGWVAGILGGALGLAGAVIGLLSGLGRARRLVLGTMWAIGIVGAGCLGLGGLALLQAQPYAMFYPLLLVGLIGVVVPATLYGRIRRRYQERELRRMQALDFR